MARLEFEWFKAKAPKPKRRTIRENDVVQVTSPRAYHMTYKGKKGIVTRPAQWINKAWVVTFKDDEQVVFYERELTLIAEGESM